MQFGMERQFQGSIPDYVLQKEKFQLNGQQFYCQESHYEDQLINGVELKLKELRGLEANTQLVSFLKETQELVFFISSSLVLYNTHKKTYHHLMNVKGEVLFLKTRVDKMNNREYLIWVEKNTDDKDKEPISTVKKINKGNCLKPSKLKKKNTLMHSPEESVKEVKKTQTFMGSMMDNLMGMGQTSKSFVEPEGDIPAKSSRKVCFGSHSGYVLRVFDYSKKEFIFEGNMVMTNEKITDIFIFCSGVKSVGYILEEEATKKRHIYYRRLERNKRKAAEDGPSFQRIQSLTKITNLLFSEQESCYYYHDSDAFYKLSVGESAQEKNSAMQKYVKLNGNCEQVHQRGIEVKIKKVQFQQDILGMALNDQYLAVLTKNNLYFHSAFDSQVHIFTHQLEQGAEVPSSIEFNKSTIMMTYRNSSMVTTFACRSKTLRLLNSTVMQIAHCKEILKVFVNKVSSEIFCVVEFYKKEGRVATKNATKNINLLEDIADYMLTPVFIDLCTSYLSPASKTEAKILKIGEQKFRKLHGCAWLSGYLIQTQDSIQFRTWRHSFENKRHLAIHPTGIFVVVCFKESFKIYALTYDGMTNTYRGDSMNDIQGCAISPQGNHLAVASASMVHIYDFYSCRKLKSFTLPLGVCVQTMQYTSHYLCCYLKTKKLYVYDYGLNYKQVIAFNPRNHVNEQQSGNSGVHSLWFDAELQIIVFSAKNNLYFYNCVTSSNVIILEMDPVTCFYYCINLKTLFLGTDKGEVMSFTWPNKPEHLARDHVKVQLHASSIVSMLVSSDLKELATIGEDSSLCVTHLVVVRNMKRLEGLELIEHLSGGLSINFDFLLRKGVYQYTHTESNYKTDAIKDKEDEALNMNFIMPEERVKQKEQMLVNVTDETFKLTEVNKHEFDGYKTLTSSAKEDVIKLKDTLYSFLGHAQREKDDANEKLFNVYMEKYGVSQKAEQRLKELKEKYDRAKQKEQQRLELQFTQEKSHLDKEYQNLTEQYATQQDVWCKEKPEELTVIDEQKQEFIEQNVNVLEDMLNRYNINNSTLSCVNSNLQKEINMLTRKMDEHRFLLYRLKTNTQALQVERGKCEMLRWEKQMKLEKEDKVNLVSIEKESMKQTKILIEKDKGIDVNIFMYNKEKDMLAYMEKCVETLEHSIENIVENLMNEKKHGKEEVSKAGLSKQKVMQVHELMLDRKKELVAARNAMTTYTYNLIMAADQFIAEKKGSVLDVLLKKELLTAQDTFPKPEPHDLDKVLEQEEGKQGFRFKHLNQVLPNDNTKRHRKTADGFFKRVLKTEGDDRSESPFRMGQRRNEKVGTIQPRLSPDGLESASTVRQLLDKNRKKVIFQQNTEQKIYERIKTDQVVYKNSYRKMTNENEDLIESYNQLAMENKKVFDSLKRQNMRKGGPLKREGVSKNGQLVATPFQNYLKCKDKCKDKKQKPITTLPAQLYEI